MVDMIQSLIPGCYQCGIKPHEIGSYTPAELRLVFQSESKVQRRELEIGDRRAARICAVFASFVSALAGKNNKYSEEDFLPKYDQKPKIPTKMTTHQQLMVIKRLNKVFGGDEK